MQTKHLIIYYDLGIGGIQKKIADIATEFKHNSHYRTQSLIVLLEGNRGVNGGPDIFLSEVKKQAQVIRLVEQPKLIKIIPSLLRLIWVIIRTKPDTVLSFCDKGTLAAILARLLSFRKFPITVSYDNLPSKIFKLKNLKPKPPLHKPHSFQIYTLIKIRLRNLFWQNALPPILKNVDRIIVPSLAAKLDFTQNFKINSTQMVINRNWITINHPVTQTPDVKYDLIYIGRIDPQKNLQRLVGLVKTLKQRLPNLSVAIVGWGEEIYQLSELIGEYNLRNNVHLLGARTNTSTLLRQAKIFVLTSHFEGLPIAALEAMGEQLPVVISNYPGASELVSNRSTGYICNSDKGFIDRIVFLLKNEPARKRIGNNAYRHVIIHHSKKSLTQFIDQFTK